MTNFDSTERSQQSDNQKEKHIKLTTILFSITAVIYQVNIISGALNLKTKSAGEVMTRLEDVFMLHKQALLDFETVSLIQKRGYSRIPVYNDDRKDVVALFHAKDLAFVDPDDNMPLRTLLEFYKHPLVFTDENTKLDLVLEEFKEGKSHLAFVRQFYSTGKEDPYYEITGVVTLEDIIEEILQAEIVDETDILTDNRRKQRRKNPTQDFSEFVKIGEGQANNLISPQMALAAFQFLSSSVEPFHEKFLSSAVLRKLMGQMIYFTHRVEMDDDGHVDESKLLPLYKEGESVDHFIIILEGRVRVTVGREKLIFVSGPFSHFGVEALKDADTDFLDFTPDYSVDVIETTLYIRIPRKIYIFAYKASLMAQEKSSDTLAIECYHPGDKHDSTLGSSRSSDDSCYDCNLHERNAIELGTLNERRIQVDSQDDDQNCRQRF